MGSGAPSSSAHVNALAGGIDQPVEPDDVAKLERVEIGVVRRGAQADFAARWKVPFDRLPSLIGGEPVRIGAVFDTPVGKMRATARRDDRQKAWTDICMAPVWQ